MQCKQRLYKKVVTEGKVTPGGSAKRNQWLLFMYNRYVIHAVERSFYPRSAAREIRDCRSTTLIALEAQLAYYVIVNPGHGLCTILDREHIPQPKHNAFDKANSR